MKILTVTYHHSNNFGALLQAYALQQSLIKCKYDNRIIDYSEEELNIWQAIKKKDALSLLRTIRFNFLTAIHYKEYKKGQERCEEFHRKHLIKTKKYVSYEELKNNIPEAEMYLAGSDQLWNFLYSEKINDYTMLNFVPLSSPVATYAVSMGNNFAMKREKKERFFESLKKFKTISVRENQMVNYLQENGYGKECITHIDPVFLIDKLEWERLANLSETNYLIKEKYVLCFELIRDNKVQTILEDISRQYDYKIVILTKNIFSKLKGDYIIRDAGPLEFLKLMKDASMVVTTSFHGAAFSIIFEKNLYAVLTHHAPERIKNLLTRLGMDDRIIYSDKYNISNKVDFDIVSMAIKEERKKAFNYIQKLGEM